MGPYLAQPITEKKTNKGESLKKKMKFSFCEMQGTSVCIKAGEDTWRMQPYANYK